LNIIITEHNNNIFDADWYDNYYSMENHIAILGVPDISSDIKSLGCAKETTPEIIVKVWG
jgi:hypothetical protein